jgi:excisionase family DNA binding protein
VTPQVSREALSLQEAARLLSVHEDTLKNWYRRGFIELIRVGPRLWRVPRSEITRLRKQNKDE